MTDQLKEKVFRVIEANPVISWDELVQEIKRDIAEVLHELHIEGKIFMPKKEHYKVLC